MMKSKTRINLKTKMMILLHGNTQLFERSVHVLVEPCGDDRTRHNQNDDHGNQHILQQASVDHRPDHDILLLRMRKNPKSL